MYCGHDASSYPDKLARATVRDSKTSGGLGEEAEKGGGRQGKTEERRARRVAGVISRPGSE